MSITPGKAIILTGLAALALVACGGEGTTSVDEEPSTGASTVGAGGAGGAGGMHATGGADGSGGQGGVIEVKDVEEVDWHAGITSDAEIDTVYGEEFIAKFEPSELTLSVGSVVLFKPRWDTQNIISGTYPDSDGKFETGGPGATWRYFKFNVAGTYPYWSDGKQIVITGTVYIE